jgi:hypothetical protein
LVEEAHPKLSSYIRSIDKKQSELVPKKGISLKPTTDNSPPTRRFNSLDIRI